jgi:predicted transcriptional regulator
MKQILIEIDESTAKRLEEVAPSRSRQRSEFIRRAIQQALWDIEEQKTAEAYARQPDRADEAHVDPAVWEPRPKGPKGRKKRRSP